MPRSRRTRALPHPRSTPGRRCRSRSRDPRAHTVNLDDVVASPDAALACAAALEAQLGDDSLLTVGRTHRSFSEVLADRPVHIAEVEFTAADDSRGTLALIMSVPFAEAVERASADEVLLTAARIAFEATAQRLGELASVELHIGAPAES